MAAESVVDWSVHRGLYASIEPRSALQFSFDAERRKIGKQLLKIKNESGSHLTYKIKTTGPETFKVNPCTGVIASGAEALVEIQPNMTASLDVALLAKERFLVCMMPISVIPGSQEALLSIWSNNDAIADADTHILAVSILPIKTSVNDSIRPPLTDAESIMREAHLHEVRLPDSRADQLRRDDELLGGDGFCPRSSPPINVNNCSSRLPSEGEASVLTGYTGVDSRGSVPLPPPPHSRQYEEAAGSRQSTRHYDPCVDYCEDPADPYSDYPVSCSRQLSAALILALSIFAWWGYHSVTPEPLSWSEWFYRKMGVRYWTP